MKNLYRVGLFISFLSFALFSCRHGAGTGEVGGGGGGDTPSNDPELSLASMSIHGVDVKDGKVSIEAEKIESANIKAKFNYGSVTEEEITVVLENSPITIAEGETKELNLKVEAVAKKHKEWTGKVSVKREKPLPKLLTGIIVIGGRDHGSPQREVFNKEKLTPILKGEETTVEVLGPLVRILFASVDKKWDSVTVNNKKLDVRKVQGFESMALHVGFLVKTEPEEFSFEIVSGGEKLTGKLKLLRKQDLADISELELFINDKEIKKNKEEAPEGELLEVLWKNNYEIAVGQDSANIQVASVLQFIKEVTIDGHKVAPTKKKMTIDGGQYDYYVAEYKIEGVGEQAKEVTVEIAPTLTTIFQPVIWKFKIKK